MKTQVLEKEKDSSDYSFKPISHTNEKLTNNEWNYHGLIVFTEGKNNVNKEVFIN